jgi:hypothetical protein
MLYVVELIVYSDGLSVDCHGSFLYTLFNLYNLLTIDNFPVIHYCFQGKATFASFIYLLQSQIDMD